MICPHSRRWCPAPPFCDSEGCVAVPFKPYVRVKAWRVPNEDGPSWDIVIRRAAPSPILRSPDEVVRMRSALDLGSYFEAHDADRQRLSKGAP